MTKRSVLLAGTGLGALLAFATVHAAETERGRLLYENHCTGCHTSTVHVRSQHTARSLEDIDLQVRRWADELGLDWSDEDVGAVQRYLYGRYYHFDKKQNP